ncbi:uncharacterized protein M8220_011104 [Acridotheres tristis]
MEVTTVSPSPASPTEGDDLCETDVTNVAIHSVALLICLCGLAGNGAGLCPFSSSHCTDLLADLTAAHLLFLLFRVPSTLPYWCIERYWPIEFRLWYHFHPYQHQLRVMISPLHWAFLCVVTAVILMTLTTARDHIPLPAQCPSMEVSTVSPLFTSPPNGPGLCEIDVTNVAIHSVTLLVCLCGLAGNGPVLWLLHINTITDFIFNQAFTDFFFLLITVPSTLLVLLEEVSCSTIMPQIYLSLLFQLSLFSYNIWMCRLMFISIERCKSILCPFLCGCQLPERLLFLLTCVLFWAFFFVFIVVNPTVTSLCQSQDQGHCRVVLLSMYILNPFLFATPMVISSTTLFIHFMPGSQQQQPKRLDIVFFLIALFSLPLSLWYFLQQFGYTVLSSQVVFLLACINSSIKPFIYFLVGSWRRDYSIGSCWRQCSMESCRRHFSIKSLRKALHRVFGKPEENPASSDVATTERAHRLPSTLTTGRDHIPLPAQCPSMEVTTVFPSPASPTEGDDLCETDVPSVAIHSVALLFCLCGLTGNGAVLWLLGLRSLCRNTILILTFIDFLFLLFLMPSILLFLLEDVSCSVIMPLKYVGLVFQVPWMSYMLWLYTLTLKSIQRCRSMHCPLWHCCHRPQNLSKVVCALLWAFSITVITIFFTWISLCAFLPPEHCRVYLISIYTFNLLLCAPFMLISITILYINVKSGSRQQQPKSLDIVICLTVLLTLPFSLWNLLQELGYTIYSSPVAFLLTCLYSSIKPLIYFLVGRCWSPCSVESLRLSLQRVFEEKKGKTSRRSDSSRDTGV